METLLFSQDAAAVQSALYNGCMIMATIFFMIFLSLTVFDTRANYGRYTVKDYGPQVPGILDWYMHGTSILALAICTWVDKFDPLAKPQAALLLAMFFIHYFQRSFIFPLQMDRSKIKPVPMLVLLMGSSVCWMNGLLNSRYLTKLFDEEINILQLIVGAVIWLLGFYGNIWHDRQLLKLKKASGGVYVIPTGGLFEYISGANFFCEIVEWLGYAIASNFSPPALLMFYLTASNIGPRGVHHHQYYLEKFPDYPKDRKAIIPFIL